MSIQMNQSLSVDCAVFGFNGKSLKVLLIERRYYAPDTRLDKLKLPGAMILDNETLPQAAYRVHRDALLRRDSAWRGRADARLRQGGEGRA